MDGNNLTKVPVNKDIFPEAPEAQTLLSSISIAVNSQNSYNIQVEGSNYSINRYNASPNTGYGHNVNQSIQNNYNNGFMRPLQTSFNYNYSSELQRFQDIFQNNINPSTSGSSVSAGNSPYQLSPMQNSVLYPDLGLNKSESPKTGLDNNSKQNSNMGTLKAAVSAAIASAEASAAFDNGITPRRKRKKSASSSYEATGKNYPCDQCEKVFHRPYNLRSHLKSHSTEKPFSCKFCGRKFTRGHDNKRHELLHEGSKKFSCGGFLKNGKTRWGCNKKFARADALGRHFRTETGWMCIEPLMAEARETEEEEADANHLLNKNQIFVNSQTQTTFPSNYNQTQNQMFDHNRLDIKYDNGSFSTPNRSTFFDRKNNYSNLNFNGFEDPNTTSELIINDILKNVR